MPEPTNPELEFRRATAKVLRDARAATGMSLREFGELVGVAHTSLHAAEKEQHTPTIDTLARVAEARGLSLAAILALVLAEISGSARGDSALSRLIEAASTLSPRQIDEMVGFADYLRHRDRVRAGREP